MRKLIGIVVLLAVVAGGFFAYQFLSRGLVIRIRQDQIQQQLDQRFPIEKTLMLVAKVVVAHPQVNLQESGDRLRFGVDVTLSVPTQQDIKGSAAMSGKVEYDAEKGEFFLTDAQVEKLEMPGIPEKYGSQVQTVLGTISKEVLNRIPLYSLKDSDRAQAMAKLFLKDVSVGGGELRVTMGLK